MSFDTKGISGLGNTNMALLSLAKSQLQDGQMRSLQNEGISINANASGSGKVGAAETKEDVEKAATQFESLLIKQMLNAMWETVPKDGMFSGGKEEEFYRDMFNEGLADNIANNQSIGIKEVIAKDISKLQEKK